MKQPGIYEHIHTSVPVDSLHKHLLLMIVPHFYKRESFVKIHQDADHKSLTSSRVVPLALRKKIPLSLEFFFVNYWSSCWAVESRACLPETYWQIHKGPFKLQV